MVWREGCVKGEVMKVTVGLKMGEGVAGFLFKLGDLVLENSYSNISGGPNAKEDMEEAIEAFIREMRELGHEIIVATSIIAKLKETYPYFKLPSLENKGPYDDAMADADIEEAGENLAKDWVD